MPGIFQKAPEEALIRLQGHISSMNIHTGSTPYENTFAFTIKETPEKTFQIGGLRIADQSLLTNFESLAEEFTLWVEKSDYRQQDTAIRVYGLSTPKITFLDKGNGAADARKSRIFLVIVGVSSLLGAVRAGFWLRRRFRREHLRPEHDAIDPLVMVMVENPVKAVAGILSLVFLIGAWFLPFKIVLAQGVISGLGYYFFLRWYRVHFAEVSWLHSIVERHRTRQEELSQRLATTAPKHVKAVQVLLKSGANVNVRDKKGCTPLFIAAHAGEVEAVSLLLSSGADSNIADHSGKTPLMAASAQGHLGVIMKLFKAGARVNVADDDGNSALILAQTNRRNKAVVDYLSTALIKEKIADEKAAREAAEKVAKEAVAKEAASKTGVIEAAKDPEKK